MKFLNKLTDFFLKPSVVEERKQKNSKKNNQTSEILKNLFIKNDPMSLTEFPYHWEKDFFAPLEPKERIYMINEIKKWYSIYIELFLDKIIEAISLHVLKQNVGIESVESFNKEFPEEFNMMIQEIIQKHIPDVVEEIISAFSDDYLIFWKPRKGQNSWEPPKREIVMIIKRIANLVVKESKEQLEIQRQQLKKLLEEEALKNHQMYNEKVLSVLTEYLSLNKDEIVRNCYSRFLLEYNSFPHYYGLEEKIFHNEIYNKYKDNFGIQSYNELMAKVFPELERFIRLHGKEELRTWLHEQWNEFTFFMKKEYSHALENGIKLEERHFNKYVFAIDFFALMLFKINIDGM